jgi:protein tyrosine phosphatase domain-containing protein 1
VGSLNNILDVVKVMQFALSEGKVAVHCHAGLGRTGVTIACYLVFTNAMDPYEAIHYVRSKRYFNPLLPFTFFLPVLIYFRCGAIQTQGQIECIHQFSQYLRPLRQVFAIERLVKS